MSNFDYVHRQVFVLNRVHDPILSLANPIPLPTGQLLTAERTRVIGQLLDLQNESSAILLVSNGLDLLDSRRLDENPIASHAASDP